MNAYKIIEKCPVKLYGFNIPVGAMYGQDKKGVWVCLDYRIKRTKRIAKPHYTKVRNASGVFVSKLVSPAKYAYSLKIFRLHPDFVGSRYDAGSRWEPVIESSKTTDKILELFDRYPEKCDVQDWGSNKQVTRFDPKTGKAFSVNVSSKRAAQKLARPMNRRVVQEYTPYARPY